VVLHFHIVVRIARPLQVFSLLLLQKRGFLFEGPGPVLVPQKLSPGRLGHGGGDLIRQRLHLGDPFIHLPDPLILTALI